MCIIFNPLHLLVSLQPSVPREFLGQHMYGSQALAKRRMNPKAAHVQKHFQ